MKHLKLLFVLCCLINIFFLQAQNALVLKNNAGTENSYYLSNIQKITFENGNLVLKNNDLSTYSYLITEISFLRFRNMTASPQIEDSKITTQFFPNPTKDQLNIRYFANCIEEVRFQLIDINGKIVFNQSSSSQSETNTITLSMSELQNGLYICRIQIGNKSASRLIIKN